MLCFCPLFIDDVSAGETAKPGSHVESQCHDLIILVSVQNTLLAHQEKLKKKKLETNTPETTAG